MRQPGHRWKHLVWWNAIELLQIWNRKVTAWRRQVCARRLGSPWSKCWRRKKIIMRGGEDRMRWQQWRRSRRRRRSRNLQSQFFFHSQGSTLNLTIYTQNSSEIMSSVFQSGLEPQRVNRSLCKIKTSHIST